MFDPSCFFELKAFAHARLFADCPQVWLALKHLKAYMDDTMSVRLEHEQIVSGEPLARPVVLYHGELLDGSSCNIRYGDATKGGLEVYQNGDLLEGATVIMAGAVLVGSRIELGQGVLIESGALVKEPAIIGDRSEIRQGAYMRGYCLIGERCVVGHTTEVKHSVFLDDAKAGHFAYLGDSILGGNANLGAGTKFANLRFLPGNVKVRTPDGLVDSGLRKFGAILGDGCQTGCNSVTNPGTVFGPGSILMPNTTAASGFHPEKSVIH